MIKKGLGYFTGLIALYIVVNSASNSGTLMTDGATGFAKVTGALQGKG